MSRTELVDIKTIAAALGCDLSTARRRATKEKWGFVGQRVRGGRRRLYHASKLPPAILGALADHLLRSAALPPSVPSSEELPAAIEDLDKRLSKASGKALDSRRPSDPRDLKQWQRACMEARLALLAEVDRLAAAGLGRMRAREKVADAAQRGELAPGLQRLVAVANQRGGKSGSRSLTAASLRRWEAALAEGGQTALAPLPGTPARVLPPEWFVAFMGHWATPAKRSVPACIETLKRARPELQVPPLRTVQRELSKLGAIARNRGRMGPRQLKALQAFVRRSTDDLWPGAVFTADGHSFDARIAHPIHGRPFRPEMTTVADVYTRRICGWSVALSESTWAVLDALRHAVTTSSNPLIWYVDRGSGYNNERMDDALTGFLARLTIRKENSLPYNSQARGLIERLHQSCWVPAAKQLPTYLGAAMDPEARKAVDKRLARDMAATGSSPLLPSWSDFLRAAEAVVAEYNARPHSGLPRILDPETGQRRHQSPDEAWQAAIAAGWQPEPVTGELAEDLFRPQERRKVARGEVSIFGNRYFLEGLDAWHGEEVLVGYDIHDADRVWVRTLDQQLIGVAAFEGNSVAYFPRSVLEQAQEARTKGRLQRLDAHRAEIEAELGPALIEARAETPLTPIQLADAEAALARIETKHPHPGPLPQGEGEGGEVVGIGNRPVFRDDLSFVRWCLEQPDAIEAGDLAHLKTVMRSGAFRLRLEALQQIDPQRVFALIEQQTREGQRT